MRPIFVVLALFCLRLTAIAQDPASNEDEAGAPEGQRPYEMEWAGRTQPEHPELTGFEDLSGWTIRSFNGARAAAYRSRQERLYGEYSMKLVYAGESAISSFILEPPQPIPIPCAFTGVNLWVRGNNWGWVNPPATSRVGVYVRVRDAKDEDYRVPLGTIDFDYWSILHETVVSPDGKSRHYEALGANNDGVLDFPARFTGIEVVGCASAAPARLYFDSLQCYVMEYKPLFFTPGPETLPWPTTPDTILPLQKEATTIAFTPGDKVCRWTVEAPSGDLAYTYRSGDGSLSDIQVEMGGKIFHPCWRGGITFDLNGKRIRPGDAGVTARCAAFECVDAGCRVDWELASGEAVARYRYALRVKGKSLVVDVTAEGRQAAQLDIGLAHGLNDAKTVFFPYLTYGMDWPKVVFGAGGGPFLLALPDYYNSDASELFGEPRLHEAGAIGYTGGAVYLPRTDGVRNPLRERIFINVSRDVQEVLPNIPNPNCDTGDAARECLWRNIGPAHQNEMLARYKAYGIDKFIACHHEVGWREGGESFTLRDRPAPSIGDERLAQYGAFVRGLGYRFGTYTNYVDFAPVNANWNEDDVCLDSEGRWQKAWPRTYALKPLRAVEKEAEYAPRIHERYGTTAQYCDVHTAYSPWGRTDYDARTPGAGMFRTQFNAFARLLWNESSAHHGPVFSEGNHHWFYAGIVDGNYATIYPYGAGEKCEPLVDFDLLRMHPKMTDFGMGFPVMYYGETGDWTKNHSRLSPYFDRFMTATIAFGHIGFLTEEWGLDGTLKSYYLLQALQQRYAMIPVRKIEYFNGDQFVDTSTALATEAHKRRQIHVAYENGLETWSNLSERLDWPLSVDGTAYLLPPASFIAFRPGDILVSSASVDGVRRDVVRCADYLYLDTRGGVVHTPELSTRGAVAVKPADDGWWVIPCTAAEEVSIGLAWLNADSQSTFRAMAYTEAGEEAGMTEVRHGAETLTVMPLAKPGVMKYKLRREPHRDFAWGVELPRKYAVPGETLSAKVSWDPPAHWEDSQAPYCLQVLPDGTQVPCKLPVAHPARGKAMLPLRIPEDTTPFTRCWFQWHPYTSSLGMIVPRWIDVTILPAFELALECETRTLSPAAVISLTGVLKSHLDAPAEAEVVLTGEGWNEGPGPRRIHCAPEEVCPLRWALPPGLGPGLYPIVLRASEATRTSELRRYLRIQPSEWVVADLARTPFRSGIRYRGQAESACDMPSTGACCYAVQENIGGETRDALFMHPPYQHGVGLTFAEFAVTLPAGRPRIDFALGFRAGSTTQDGCAFKAVFNDGLREQEVFSEQYATLNQWLPRTASLEAFAGKSGTLRLITDVGPADNSYSDWAVWGAPRIVMDEPAYQAALFEAPQPTLYGPAPAPLPGLTREDLRNVKSAKIALETAGVNGGEYASFLYFNGIKAGAVPESPSDVDWHAAELSLPAEALATLAPFNTLVIKNPGKDYMKVRALCLRFELADGRTGSSTIALGPWCSAAGWAHAEGESVSVGNDLTPLLLEISAR